MNTAPALIVIDGSAYLYRAFHALPALVSPTGQPTGALYGILQMLRKLLGQYPDERMVVVLDHKGPTFRHDWYPAYKAHRPPMPPELVAQIEPLLQLLRLLGLPVLQAPGVEADDVMATLAHTASQADQQVLIISSDKDMMQVVSQRVHMWDPLRDKLYTPQAVQEKFGVPPEQVVDCLALLGDTSDNVPGVPGVGPKTAAKWLQAHHSLDNLLRLPAGTLPGKAGAALHSMHEQIRLNQRLITLQRDVPAALPWDAFTRSPVQPTALRDCLNTWGFQSLMQDLTGQATRPSTTPAPTVHHLTTPEAWAQWCAQLRTQPVVIVEPVWSTDPLSPVQAMAMAFPEPWSCYRWDARTASLPWEACVSHLPTDWPQPSQRVIGHHLKPLMKALWPHRTLAPDRWHDVMLLSHVLHNEAHSHTLEAIASRVGHTLPPSEHDADAEHAITSRLQVIWDAYRTMWQRIQKTPASLAVYQTLDQPLLPVLAHMERTGMTLDTVCLQDLSHDLDTALTDLHRAMEQEAGCAFNPHSPQQVRKVLFEDLKLPVLKRTPKREPSTQDAALTPLAAAHPLVQHVLEHRHLSKLQHTYVDKLPALVHTTTGRIHTTLHPTGTHTGRLSSSHPNVQNIPVKTPWGRRVRSAFVPQRGWCMVSADYTQIELRILAHVTRDPGLTQAFLDGVDVHRATAAHMHGLALDAVDDTTRQAAKAINFGLIYGMSSWTLASHLGVSEPEAAHLMEVYFARYPNVHDWIQSCLDAARRQGYVETLMGRRLTVPHINARSAHARKAAERVAVNAVMQGTAADLIKRAMCQVHHALVGQPAHLLLQIHDELLLEASPAYVPCLTELLTHHMIHAAAWSVPLEVHVHTGSHWADAS